MLALAGIALTAGGWTTDLMAAEAGVTCRWLGQSSGMRPVQTAKSAKICKKVAEIMKEVQSYIEDSIGTNTMDKVCNVIGYAAEEQGEWSGSAGVIKLIKRWEKEILGQGLEYRFVEAYLLDIVATFQLWITLGDDNEDKRASRTVAEAKQELIGDETICMEWNGGIDVIKDLIAMQANAGYISERLTGGDGQRHIETLTASGSMGRAQEIVGEQMLRLMRDSAGTNNPRNVLTIFNETGGFAAIRNDYGDTREYEVRKAVVRRTFLGYKAGEPEFILRRFLYSREMSEPQRTVGEIIMELKKAVGIAGESQAELLAALERTIRTSGRNQRLVDILDQIKRYIERGGELSEKVAYQLCAGYGDALSNWARRESRYGTCWMALEETVGLQETTRAGDHRRSIIKVLDHSVEALRTIPNMIEGIKTVGRITEQYGETMVPNWGINCETPGWRRTTKLRDRFKTLKAYAEYLERADGSGDTPERLGRNAGAVEAVISSDIGSAMAGWYKGSSTLDNVATLIRAVNQDMNELHKLLNNMEGSSTIVPVQERESLTSVSGYWDLTLPMWERLSEAYLRRSELGEVDREFIVALYEGMKSRSRGSEVQVRETGTSRIIEAVSGRKGWVFRPLRRSLVTTKEDALRIGLRCNKAIRDEVSLIALQLDPIGVTSEWRHANDESEQLTHAIRYMRERIGISIPPKPIELENEGRTVRLRRRHIWNLMKEEGIFTTETEREVEQCIRGITGLETKYIKRQKTPGEWFALIKQMVNWKNPLGETAFTYFEAARMQFIRNRVATSD
jgi:hypothetical protein